MKALTPQDKKVESEMKETVACWTEEGRKPLATGSFYLAGPRDTFCKNKSIFKSIQMWWIPSKGERELLHFFSSHKLYFSHFAWVVTGYWHVMTLYVWTRKNRYLLVIGGTLKKETSCWSFISSSLIFSRFYIQPSTHMQCFETLPSFSSYLSTRLRN